MSAIPVYPATTYVPTRAKAKTRSRVLSKVVAFSIVTGISFSASSIVGNVMVEKARQAKIDASKIAKEARGDVALIRSQVDKLQNLIKVSEWATNHGLVPTAAASSLAKNEGSDRT